MDIRQLRFLTALARERHFARAAAQAGVTQSTLSGRIRQLENELGAIIVERGNRFQGFTPEGERVLHWARRILADCDALTQDLDLAKGSLSGQLVLGSIPSALPCTSDLTRPFRARHPDVRIAIRSMNSREIVRGLESFEINLGLTYLKNEALSGVRTLPVYTERYVAVVPRDMLPAAPTALRWSEAASLPLCLLTPDMQNRRIIDSIFNSVGAHIEPVIETNALTALYAQVRAGGIATILPEHHISVLPADAGLLCIPLTEPVVSQPVGLVALDQEPLTIVVRAMWAVAAEIVQMPNPRPESQHIQGTVS